MLLELSAVGLSTTLLAGGMNPSSFWHYNQSGWLCSRTMQGPGHSELQVKSDIIPDLQFPPEVEYRVPGKSNAFATLVWSAYTEDWITNFKRANIRVEHPKPENGPVFATVDLDGVVILRQSPLSARHVKDLGASRFVESTVYLGKPTEPARFKFRNASRFTVLITGPDGRRLAQRVFRLPDWTRADRFVQKARVQIEEDARDYRHRCAENVGGIEEPDLLLPPIRLDVTLTPDPRAM